MRAEERHQLTSSICITHALQNAAKQALAVKLFVHFASIVLVCVFVFLNFIQKWCL